MNPTCVPEANFVRTTDECAAATRARTSHHPHSTLASCHSLPLSRREIRDAGASTSKATRVWEGGDVVASGARDHDRLRSIWSCGAFEPSARPAPCRFIRCGLTALKAIEAIEKLLDASVGCRESQKQDRNPTGNR